MTTTASCSPSRWALALVFAVGCTADTTADSDGPETFGSGMGTDAATDSADNGGETDAPTSETSTSTSDSSTTDTTNGTNGQPCDAPMTACGVQCVDTDTDTTNCGACGITCVIPNGESGCAAGSCTVEDCDDGWSDCDGDPTNGCEAQSTCQGGAECMTECGSTGVVMCNASCEAVCSLPAESCNAIDDDCNGQCDEGLMDCRVGVHRSFGNGHFYTTDLNEAMSGGYNLEFQDFYFLYGEQAGGLQPFFRCLKPNGRYLYTTSTDCEGLGAPQVTVGFISAQESCGSTPLYRVHSAGAGNHFYTVSANERDNAVANLGYADEGIAGHVWAAP